MPGSFETEEKKETAQEIAEALAAMQSPSPVIVTPTPTPKGPRQQKGFVYDSDTEDSLSEEEKANINPIRRRIKNFTLGEGYLRTCPPIKDISRLPTPEEDKIQ